MSKPFVSPRFSALALAAGLALSAGAWAAEHGGDHGSDHAAKAEPKAEGKEPDIRPKLKPVSKVEGTEIKAEPKSESKGEAKGEAKRESNSVSMAELREMIDQKIAEVRTKQTAAPVLRVQPRSAAAKPKREPAVASASAGSGHDAHGALLPVGKPGVQPSHDEHLMGHDLHWAYSGDTGPDSWARLKPEFQQCASGKRQSPIDIRDGIPVQMDPIQFDYRASTFRVLDNGHTVQVNVEPGNSITVMGHRYELVQFHFHRPSEERINGRQYEMEAHFEHRDAQGKEAVVAVLMDQGKAHPMVQMVWNNLPLEKHAEQLASSPIDLALMLPEQRQYYTYMGSQGTPPCTEGVLWMVMKQPATMSREQVAVFSRLYPMNARPVQQVAGRLIKDGQ